MFSAANAGVADVRVDEESKEKYQSILDLLLAGGYFRARISGLSPFDKVIGGMAWAITSSAGDLDIDIFFQEDAQIGQKIKLGEQILDGLKRLGCTLPLQSFQIQGLDFKSIYPVIQWLITKVMEVRAETGDLVRAYSEAQFNKAHSMPSDAAFALKLPKAALYAAAVTDAYRPRRQFVHRGDSRALGAHEEIQLVLLEYGARGATAAALAAAAAASSSSSSSTANKDKDKSAEKSEALAKEEEAAYQRRMARLAALGDADLSDQSVAGFIPSAKIAAMLDNFEAGLNAEDGPIAGVQAKKMAERQHATRVASLEEQVAQYKQDGQKLTAKNNAARDEHEQLASELAQKRAFTARVRAAIAELDALETDENRPVLEKLKQLVALNEAMRTHEAAFRRSCAAELARLKALIAEAEQKARAAADEGGLAEREALLSEAESKDARKREQLENALAERRCAIAAAERQLDAVPSRVEMQQYQRQFVELYEQIAAKEVETRRYFNTYNTLEDTRTFLNRETSIYSSILEGYKVAMSSKSGRANFVSEMANIAKSVGDTLAKVTGKLETEAGKKQALEQQLKELVDKERLFVKLAGKFADACSRNEKLEAEIAQLTAAAAAGAAAH